jgi:hypothetical protein
MSSTSSPSWAFTKPGDEMISENNRHHFILKRVAYRPTFCPERSSCHQNEKNAQHCFEYFVFQSTTILSRIYRTSPRALPLKARRRRKKALVSFILPNRLSNLQVFISSIYISIVIATRTSIYILHTLLMAMGTQ